MKNNAKEGAKQALIALGSNLGDRAENLRRAVWAIGSLPGTKVLLASGIYETKPVGYAKQGDFYNAAVKIQTTLSPHALLGACLGIEAGMGRVRGGVPKNGPRVIDLDLLLYEDFTCESEELTVPHPRMEERAFVLAPLCEIYYEPRYKKLLGTLGNAGVRRTGEGIVTP